HRSAERSSRVSNKSSFSSGNRTESVSSLYKVLTFILTYILNKMCINFVFVFFFHLKSKNLSSSRLYGGNKDYETPPSKFIKNQQQHQKSSNSLEKSELIQRSRKFMMASFQSIENEELKSNKFMY